MMMKLLFQMNVLNSLKLKRRNLYYCYIGISVLYQNILCFAWPIVGTDRLRENARFLSFSRSPFIASSLSPYGSSLPSISTPPPLNHLRNYQYIPTQRLYLSSSSVERKGDALAETDDTMEEGACSHSITLKGNEEGLTLEDQLQDAYMMGETDGIMKISPELLKTYGAMELVQASLDAFSQQKKGQVAGIINALIGSCCSDDAPPNHDMAWDLLQSFDSISKEANIYPDIVTFCNVYSSFFKRAEMGNDSRAAEVLERAQKYSKKIAGSKRRRVLVKARNKKGNDGSNKVKQVRDYLEDFKLDYGQDFDVLFEDDDIVVISKPSGMVCFHKRKTTSGKVKNKKKKTKVSTTTQQLNFDRDISLEDALMDKGIPLSTLNPEAMGIVHRIDRGTSGCIVLAKNDHSHALLVTDFFTRNVKKSYLALTHTQNDDSMNESGTIDLPVTNRPAISKFRIQQKFQNAMLLKVETLTGRKHQVRIHCAEGLNSPIFLDPLYFPKTEESTIPEPIKLLNETETKKDKFFLHASTLSLPSFDVNVTSPIPILWTQVLEKL